MSGKDVALVWFLPEQYQKAVTLDAKSLPKTYAAWERRARETEKTCKRVCNRVVRVYLDVDIFKDWCDKNNLLPNQQSRADYALVLYNQTKEAAPDTDLSIPIEDVDLGDGLSRLNVNTLTIELFDYEEEQRDAISSVIREYFSVPAENKLEISRTSDEIPQMVCEVEWDYEYSLSRKDLCGELRRLIWTTNQKPCGIVIYTTNFCWAAINGERMYLPFKISARHPHFVAAIQDFTTMTIGNSGENLLSTLLSRVANIKGEIPVPDESLFGGDEEPSYIEFTWDKFLREYYDCLNDENIDEEEI